MTAGPVVHRGGARFTGDGTRVVCFAGDDAGGQYVEGWELGAAGPRRTMRTAFPHESAASQLVALDDGRALQSWHAPARQTVELVDPAGERRTLGTSTTPLRLLPGPGGSGWPATAVAPEADGTSMVHRVSDGDPWLTPVARVPGRLGGAAVCGDRLALTVLGASGPAPALLDLRTGALGPLVDPPPGTACHVLLSAGDHVLLAVGSGSGHRLAVATASADGPVPLRLLDGLGGLGGSVTPVAMDPSGTTLALLVGRGARSELVLYDIADTTDAVDAVDAADTHAAGAVRPVRGPYGSFIPTASWGAHGLWLPYSTPTRPTAFGWLPPGASRLRTPADFGPRPSGRWTPGRLETFPGAAGPVEAVVYGADWRTSPRVVVALHGGPESHWTLAFDRLFQTFADAGLTVVAPNQRGSTGYGKAYAGAIVGAWGGPDLADIRALARRITAERGERLPRPALYGSSYGGFLALLAAAADPDAWSACAAVAPFHSAGALYDGATPPVRGLVERLQGRAEVHDALGPRDLELMASRIRTPVLIAHGLLDETIPVTHARQLAERLTAEGQCEVAYHEVPGRGHLLFEGNPADPVVLAVTGFLGRDTARRQASLAGSGGSAP